MEDRILSLTKLQVAEHQLDAAIRLYLNADDFVSAITLAGAAEEILGKLLERRGNKHSVALFAESCVQIGRHVFDTDWTTKHFVEMQTFFRNNLKHITDGDSLDIPRQLPKRSLVGPWITCGCSKRVRPQRFDDTWNPAAGSRGLLNGRHLAHARFCRGRTVIHGTNILAAC